MWKDEQIAIDTWPIANNYIIPAAEYHQTTIKSERQERKRASKERQGYRTIQYAGSLWKAKQRIQQRTALSAFLFPLLMKLTRRASDASDPKSFNASSTWTQGGKEWVPTWKQEKEKKRKGTFELIVFSGTLAHGWRPNRKGEQKKEKEKKKN